MNREPPPVSPPTARKPRRANADHRWTVPKVTAFLEAEAARSVGMGRQSAYRLRARLAGTRFAAAFEGARKQGIRARAAASAARAASRWDGPLIGAYLRTAQGNTARAHGDSRTAQGDAIGAQGDGNAPKTTKESQDCVTSVTRPPAQGGARVSSRGLSAGPGRVVSSRFAKGDL